jgi:hypothetical protein
MSLTADRRGLSSMGIGASIFLIAAGAILTFALNRSWPDVNLDTVGWILMGAGVLGLIITMALFGSRRRTTSSERRVYDPRNPNAEYVEQQRTTDDGAPPPVV